MAADDYIKLTECKDRHIYLVEGEKLGFCVYAGNGWFTGIPENQQDEFLFSERHIDCKDPAGTIRPAMEFGPLPQGICPVPVKFHASGDLWFERNSKSVPVYRRMIYGNSPPHGDRVGFEDVFADTYVRIPDEAMPFKRGNTPLWDYLHEYDPTKGA